MVVEVCSILPKGKKKKVTIISGISKKNKEYTRTDFEIQIVSFSRGHVQI